MRSTSLLGLFALVQMTACNGPDDPADDVNDDTGQTNPVELEVDADLDGMTVADGDCDDSNPGVFDGAQELCDGIDNNCDDAIDEGLDRTFYEDYDHDGYGNPDAMVGGCAQPEGYVLTAGDCNDRIAAINPDAVELCDAEDVDEDCDELIDVDDPDVANARTFYVDADGDGYGEAGVAGTAACDDIVGQVTNAYDCDDGNAAINPNELEICDGLAMDDDCDGLVDDADPESLKIDYWPDDDGDSYGDELTPATYTCFDLLDSGYVLNGVDCDDTEPGVNPDATEICTDALVDEDCDGDVDVDDDDTTTYSWYADADADGYGEAGTTPTVTCQLVEGSAPRAGDCRDDLPEINPGQDELCNVGEDIDEDCDSKIDEEDPETPAIDHFIDTDGDGYGESSTVVSTCDVVFGYVTDGGDCDEADTAINPGMFDDCEDGIDNDCDGAIDNCSIGEVSMSTADATITGTAMYEYAGDTLANIGDINGDGNGDLAISTNNYGAGYTYVGQVSLMFGPLSGTMTTASSGADLTGSVSYSYFGWNVAGNKDMDLDGQDDMIVGTYNVGERAYLYYGPITADATTTDADATFSGTYSYDYFGFDIDLTDDYDGDGVPDVVVMAPFAERGAGYSSTGAVYVWSGPVTGAVAASTADYLLGGSSNYDNLTYNYGNAHAAVGDLDGDGLADFAAAAPWLTPSGTSYWSAGRLYLSYGGSVTAGTYDIGAVADATITGDTAYYYFGYGGIANAADYDGDGYDDLIASAYQASFGGYSYNGVTFVFAGPISGDISTSGYTTALAGGTNNEYSGQKVKSGDFNDDGLSDVLISVPNHSTVGCSYCGGAYLAMGGVTGDQDLSDAFATIIGATMYASAGRGISFVSDWDGDGRDEVAVSSYNSPTYDGLTAVLTGGNLFP